MKSNLESVLQKKIKQQKIFATFGDDSDELYLKNNDKDYFCSRFDDPKKDLKRGIIHKLDDYFSQTNKIDKDIQNLINLTNYYEETNLYQFKWKEMGIILPEIYQL